MKLATQSKPMTPATSGLIVALGDEIAARLDAAYADVEGVTVEAADDAMELAQAAGRRPALVVADAAVLPVRELLPMLADVAPAAKVVAFDPRPDMRRGVDAFRAGCLDYLDPRDAADAATLRRRTGSALARCREENKVDRRLARLRSAVRKLNGARREVGQKVDVLCTDLVGAYGELSKKLDAVRQRQEATKLFDDATDLEQLLCHLMDYLLRRLGHCNIAVYLTGEAGLELGAYMKYTVAGDKELTDALAEGLAVQVQRRGVLHAEAEDAAEVVSVAEADLAQSTIFGVDCQYLAESLATFVCFRDGRAPFGPEDMADVEAVAPHFAAVLTKIVRGDEAWDDEDEQAGYGDFGGDLLDPGEDEDGEWWQRSDRGI